MTQPQRLPAMEPVVLEDELPVEWQYAAVLWLPDPEARRGWRDYFVKRPESRPGSRKVGF